jgi:hypothetical protein
MYQERGEHRVTPEAARYAARRRDLWLTQTRKLTQYVAVGAAAVSIGLGAVFAHDLPGHRSFTARTGGPAVQQGSARPASPGAAPQHQGPAGSTPASAPGQGQHLSQPPQAPAPAPAAPQVTSGGS